jgi:hypothetical protein
MAHDSMIVQQDPQVTHAAVLRPFVGFEKIYQGRDPTVPLAFFPSLPNAEQLILDPEAGSDGFDPKLMQFVKVPFGAQCICWFPHIWQGQSSFVQSTYKYTFVWRIRNVLSFQRSVRRGRDFATPYHFMEDFIGKPDGLAPVATRNRYVVPCATRSVVVEQAEVAGDATQVQNLRREDIDVRTQVAAFIDLPLLPDGTSGHLQQGVLDPAQNGTPSYGAQFLPFRFTAEGDELLITATRVDQELGDWDFETDGADIGLSSLYGGGTYPGIGIYLFIGT